MAGANTGSVGVPPEVKMPATNSGSAGTPLGERKMTGANVGSAGIPRSVGECAPNINTGSQGLPPGRNIEDIIKYERLPTDEEQPQQPRYEPPKEEYKH